MNIQENEETGCHTNRQAGNIYEGEYFMFPEVAQGNFQVILKHVQVL